MSAANTKRVTKTCEICGRMFRPDKWHPYQVVCSREKCKRSRRLLAYKKWRQQYPEYFRDRTDNLESLRKWRKANLAYHREYRRKHPEIVAKTREYVRRHRAKKRAGAGTKPPAV